MACCCSLVPLVALCGHQWHVGMDVDGNHSHTWVCWSVGGVVCKYYCSDCFYCTWYTKVHCSVWLCILLCCSLPGHKLSILGFPNIRPSLWKCLSHWLHWTGCPGLATADVIRTCFSIFCCSGSCHLGELGKRFLCSHCCLPVPFGLVVAVRPQGYWFCGGLCH